jgi:hypothetical protein
MILETSSRVMSGDILTEFTSMPKCFLMRPPSSTKPNESRPSVTSWDVTSTSAAPVWVLCCVVLCCVVLCGVSGSVRADK